jgi:CRP-like cAMP-binding protein
MVTTMIGEKVRTLGTLALFASLSERELRVVADLCAPFAVDKGRVLITERTPGQECFLIAEGTALVTIKAFPIATLGRGDFVGEMALLDGGRRTATVTALTPMDTFVFSAREFRSLLYVSPTIARRIAANLARRLRATQADDVTWR